MNSGDRIALREKAAEFSGSSFHCYLFTVVVLLMPKIYLEKQFSVHLIPVSSMVGL